MYSVTPRSAHTSAAFSQQLHSQSWVLIQRGSHREPSALAQGCAMKHVDEQQETAHLDLSDATRNPTRGSRQNVHPPARTESGAEQGAGCQEAVGARQGWQ